VQRPTTSQQIVCRRRLGECAGRLDEMGLLRRQQAVNSFAMGSPAAVLKMASIYREGAVKPPGQV
jgi:hypothetical protein